jgi:predicted MFS family arabinose efflux permease
MLTSRLPRRHSRRTGLLAARRRKQVTATAMILLVLNVLVWTIFGDWPTRAMVLIVCVLAAPVLHTMLFRRP